MGRPADELDNWVGADEVVLSTLPTGNNLVPRQSAENMRVSLFGVSNDNNNFKKRGRPTGLKNQSPRRHADCANRTCTRWYDCKGGERKFLCESGTGVESGYYKPREMQRRRRAFDCLLASNPTLSKAQVALAVHVI